MELLRALHIADIGELLACKELALALGCIWKYQAHYERFLYSWSSIRQNGIVPKQFCLSGSTCPVSAWWRCCRAPCQLVIGGRHFWLLSLFILPAPKRQARGLLVPIAIPVSVDHYELPFDDCSINHRIRLEPVCLVEFLFLPFVLASLYSFCWQG